mmetsp:Transcript_14039/g.24003  ORF Transcript_14039/g.24003 Transcript_14039/m.24003 type:complete len:332 (-) Transcript_14039:10-1005(-)
MSPTSPISLHPRISKIRSCFRSANPSNASSASWNNPLIRRISRLLKFRKQLIPLDVSAIQPSSSRTLRDGTRQIKGHAASVNDTQPFRSSLINDSSNNGNDRIHESSLMMPCCAWMYETAQGTRLATLLKNSALNFFEKMSRSIKSWITSAERYSSGKDETSEHSETILHKHNSYNVGTFLVILREDEEDTRSEEADDDEAMDAERAEYGLFALADFLTILSVKCLRFRFSQCEADAAACSAIWSTNRGAGCKMANSCSVTGKHTISLSLSLPLPFPVAFPSLPCSSPLSSASPSASSDVPLYTPKAKPNPKNERRSLSLRMDPADEPSDL